VHARSALGGPAALGVDGHRSPITGAHPLVRASTLWLVMTTVLGAPGSGKSAIVARLGTLLPAHVVLDWDALMEPASELAGCDVARSPATWPAYRRLVRAVVDAVTPAPLVLLGVSTPDELEGWPVDAWILLDCSETERRRRLGPRLEPNEIEEALADARQYRALGLPTIDTTGQTPEEVARVLAGLVHQLEAS
jgi:hypothetical protein